MLLVAGAIGAAVMKWKLNKKEKDITSKMAAKAELAKIVQSAAAPVIPTVEMASTNVPSDAQENKVVTGTLRKDAFTGGSENIAPPTVVKVVKQQEVQNDVGAQESIPANAFVGVVNQPDGFQAGDIVYSKGNTESRIARLISGNYVFIDKDGNSLGVFTPKNRQKLGTVTMLDDRGLFYKAAPDFKKYGFIGYEKIYKLQ